MKKKFLVPSVLSVILIFFSACQQITPSLPEQKVRIIQQKSIPPISGVVQFPELNHSPEKKINKGNIIKAPFDKLSTNVVKKETENNLVTKREVINLGYPRPVRPFAKEGFDKRNRTWKSELSSGYTFPVSDNQNNPKSSFSTKATITDVASFATISIINPSNHPSAPNKTLITGITDTNGVFSLMPNVVFTPATGDIFVLEATKRIGRTGKDNISLRTFIRWAGSKWESITTPNFYINLKTTALTIIADSQPGDVTPANTINTMDVSGPTTVPSTINANVTSTLITTVSNLVGDVLTKNADPVQYIKYQSSQYVIANPTPVTAPEVYTIYPRLGKVVDTIMIGGKNYSNYKWGSGNCNKSIT